MNKRFKELAEQAGFTMWADESWKPEGQVVDWSSEYDAELEKFGGLVIEECCKVARYYIQYQDSYDMADGVVDGLKNYFGVDE